MRNFNNVSRIKVFLKDRNKKNFLKIIKEVLILIIKKREIPFYYFKYLYRKRVENYLDYISAKEGNAIGNSKLLHKPEYKSILDNKLFFALFFEKTILNTPKLLSYNFGTSFFYNNNFEQITNKEELLRFFEKIFMESNNEEIFFRPTEGYGGKGCFKLTKENLNKELLDKYDSLVRASFVHTEVIKQHEEINKFHSKSVNTLRLISLITSENTVEIVSAFIRFGVGNSIVDNVSFGGFFVGINIEDGTLKEVGHYLSEYGGAEIKEHPDSRFKLEGFKIPFFEEACIEVKNAVKVIPDRFIGWDVAITQKGPIIIESNSGPHLPMSNIAYGGLLKNEHIKTLVKELKTVN